MTIKAFMLKSTLLPLILIAVFSLNVLACGLLIPHKVYIIPEGTKGDVFVVRGVKTGEIVESKLQELVFRIPTSRILLAQYVPNSSPYTSAYYYEKTDGTTLRLEEEHSSLHKTEENLKNFTPFVWFVRESWSNWSEVPCEVRYEQFYVGTRADMLKRSTDEYNDEELRFKEYVKGNAAQICEGQSPSKAVNTIMKKPSE
jgi:hypothetical protein